ncbi:MAG TPA: 6-phosphogluconolactonase, partial [Ferruginibacter sp.]|nr:6-phosphogluconolactonase [Ferruginibacter sp.]
MNKIDLTDSLEKIPVRIFPDPAKGSLFVAEQIASLIRQKEKEGKKAVIGLATGSSPKTLYAQLVRMHKEEGLSFKNVIAFNLDQYYPMDKDALQSYHYFMRKNLFEQTDIDPDNYHLPDGMVPKDKVKEHCLNYEKQIEDAGGLDLQILGIGVNGHIGFNEPGSGIYTKT